MRPKITRDIMIGELVMNYPSAVGVLFEYGFHCIGCGLSAYETLGQGCAAHGFDDATIDEIIRRIREAASAEKAKSPGGRLEKAGKGAAASPRQNI